jgi:hypothetical protein
MNWHKISFDRGQFKDQNLYAEFGARLLDRMPAGIALLATMTKDEADKPVEATFYFTPGCENFCPELIGHYAAQICEPPDLTEVSFILGDRQFAV